MAMLASPVMAVLFGQRFRHLPALLGSFPHHVFARLCSAPLLGGAVLAYVRVGRQG